MRPAAIRQRGRRPTPGGRPAVIDTTTLMMIALPRPVSTRLSRHSLRGDSLLRAIHQSRSGVNALNKPNETTIFWGKKKIYIYKYMFIYLRSFTTGANVGYCIGTFFFVLIRVLIGFEDYRIAIENEKVFIRGLYRVNWRFIHFF